MASRNKPVGLPPPASAEETLDQPSGPFFRRIDWAAFWTTSLVSLAAYIYTLAPTVSLEDSGELAVAADYLGVPHPPGYPIWTMLTWFVCRLFRWVTYHGQPNPAWGAALASALFGAAACGVLSMLVCRSGTDILRRMPSRARDPGRRKEGRIGWTAAVASGLLFAFSSVQWSQSVIIEVYSLNALFLVLVLLLAYRWMCRTHETGTLYTMCFLFGLGLTNHHSLLFLILGLALMIWYRDRRLFRDCLALACWMAAAYFFWRAWAVRAAPDKLLAALIKGGLLACAPAGLYLFERRLMSEGRRAGAMALLVLLALGFYAYMPVASEQNPPMNWGYARTWEGFVHAVTRGQYERIDPIENVRHALQHPGRFPQLVHEVVTNPRGYISVVTQFTWPIALLALLPFLLYRRTDPFARHWLWGTLTAFLSLTVLFLVFQYPDLDVQTLFIGRVQYIQAHAVYALWIGYGILLLLELWTRHGPRQPALQALAFLLALLTPAAPIRRDLYDKDFIRVVGSSTQRGHDFGWQFGHWQLRGVHGIRTDLEYTLKPEAFREAWKAYPTPGYPPEMEENAIFFGGTDPGRFVPTYMIYSARVREDVYLITQNALADHTYLKVMRDLYGDRIWIPSGQDVNTAFQDFVEQVRSGQAAPPGTAMQIRDGRVVVQGVQGVMVINGMLARAIFDRNKHKHAFYVEESYVIPWMYPYLEPHGLIMKLHAEPLPELPPETVENDRRFWEWYKDRLLSNPRFRRDVVARKAFSKLRSSIAGLYAARGMNAEAEEAFRQAITLYEFSPEAHFRLANLFVQQRRFGRAREILEEFIVKDPGNLTAADWLRQLQETESQEGRRLQLEGKLRQGSVSIAELHELAALYLQLDLRDDFVQLAGQILQSNGIPAGLYMEMARLSVRIQHAELIEHNLRKFLEHEPGAADAWVDLAALYAMTQRPEEALECAARAIDAGGEAARRRLREDERFASLRDREAFQALVAPVPAPAPRSFTLPLPGL